MSNMPEFGISSFRHEIPENAPAVWGARAIWDQPAWHGDKHRMSFLYDRQSWRGDEDEQKRLRTILSDGGALNKAQNEFAHLAETYQILSNESKRVVLFENDEIIMVGNSNGSCGYFYIAAWLKS